MDKRGVELPPLCCCGMTLWDTNPDTCANNCVFYRNPKGVQAQSTYTCNFVFLRNSKGGQAQQAYILKVSSTEIILKFCQFVRKLSSLKRYLFSIKGVLTVAYSLIKTVFSTLLDKTCQTKTILKTEQIIKVFKF